MADRDDLADDELSPCELCGKDSRLNADGLCRWCEQIMGDH